MTTKIKLNNIDLITSSKLTSEESMKILFLELQNSDENVSGMTIQYISPENLYLENKTLEYGERTKEEYSRKYPILMVDTIVVTLYLYKKEKEDYKDEVDLIYTIFSRNYSIEALRNMKNTDSLVDIPNQFGVFGHIIRLKERGNSHTFLFINIRNFNYYNKYYGTNNGNVILKRIGQKIYSFLRDDTEIVGRLGGDNFLAFISNENLHDFLKDLNNLQVSIEFKNKIHVIDVDAVRGISTMYNYKEDGDINRHVMAAQAAMNVARKTKKLEVVCTKEILEHTYQLKQLEIDFENALTNHEFEVVYQPKVDSKTNTLCGAEALSRWRKDGNLLSPAFFIEALERENMICELDYCVLDTVCNDIHTWLTLGIEPVKVSVNFSNLHFMDKDFARKILEIIDKYDIDTKYLELEITESSAYNNIDVIKNFIEVMHEHGISISIDDFGTGYSSLAILTNIDADVVKLDKSFADMLINGTEKKELFLKNIIRLILELNKEIIAEGVETKEQLDFMKEYGCFVIQGYYFDKPLSYSDFEQRLINKEYNKD